MEGVNVYRVLQKRSALQATSRAVDYEESGDESSSVNFVAPPESVESSSAGYVEPSVPSDAGDSPRSSIHDSVDSDKLTVLASANSEKAAVAQIMSKVLMTTEVPVDDDQQAIFQTAPRMRAPEREVNAKFLAAGDNGIGKTTFLHQLVNSYRQAPEVLFRPAAGADDSSMHQFVNDPESLTMRLGPIRVPEERLNIYLSLQDSPGVGDDINYKAFLRMLVKHLLQQQETDYKLLGGNIQHLGPAMAGTLKNSITGLLYFLPPHKLKKLDIILMAALSQLVPLIPVVGKADTMTQQEALKFRDELVAALQDADGFVGRGDSSMRPLQVNLFQFPDEDLVNVNVTPGPDKHIYFVITSDTYKDGKPVRVYPYGGFDATDREHSDFIVLKRLMMADKNNGFWSLQDSALQYYYNFCHQYEAAGLNLDSLVDSICATWAPYLDHDEYLAIKAPKETEQTKHGLMGVFSGLSMSKKGSLKHDRKNQLTGRVSHAGFSGYGGMRSRATSRATSRANSHAGGVMTLEAERSGVLAVEDAVVF